MLNYRNQSRMTDLTCSYNYLLVLTEYVSVAKAPFEGQGFGFRIEMWVIRIRPGYSAIQKPQILLFFLVIYLL